jgi:hypothetical protein
MHFGAKQLFWECHENRASENYPDELPVWAEPFWSADSTKLRRVLRLFRAETGQLNTTDPQTISKVLSVGEMYHTWGIFRISYSLCDMTNEEDKLIALLGVANDFGLALGDELVAGLWKSRLLEEACWQKHVSNPNERIPVLRHLLMVPSHP